MTSKVTEELQVTQAETEATQKKRPTSEDRQRKPKYWVQIRLFPIWLRVIFVLALFAGAGALGLTIGYSNIGEGDASEVLKWSTWQHMLDIIKGVE